VDRLDIVDKLDKAEAENEAARTLSIREATRDDLPAVLALYADPSLDNGVVLNIDEAEAIYDAFGHYPSYRLFVALHSGRIVGSYALLIMHNLAHRGAKSAIVEDVVIAGTHRGQGFGRTMMGHARTLAREAGCYKLMLSSNEKRKRAHAFYDSLGFTRHGYSFMVEL
jgi:GNAT superfamily N-acetyltransferase